MKSIPDTLKAIPGYVKSCFGAGATQDEKQPEDSNEEAEPRRQHSRPMQRVEPTGELAKIAAHNTTYTYNWAGALASNPSGQKFKSAYGTFTVPQPAKGTGSASQWAAAAWVGIDGADYNKCILQAGVDFIVNSDGTHSFTSWYEWYPAASGSFPTFHPQPGHVVTISIESSNPGKGKVTLKNHTTGHKVSKKLTAPSAAGRLRGQNAEWIVEDFMIGDSMVPLVDFKTVKFAKAHATTGKRKRVGLDGATIINMVSQSDTSNVLTNVHIPDAHSTGITYTG
jgi:hypothetical protein